MKKDIKFRVQGYFKMLNKEHEGKWIAISPDYEKIVGYSSKLEDLQKEVKNGDVVFSKVPPTGLSYAFTIKCPG